MRKEETRKLLVYLSALYPHAFSKRTDAEKDAIVDAWHSLFSKYPSVAVFRATLHAVHSSPDFVPAAAKIHERINLAIEECASEGDRQCAAHLEARLRYQEDHLIRALGHNNPQSKYILAQRALRDERLTQPKGTNND